jgi:hypothetical protein
MQLMRSLIREFNVFRWAGRMLMDAAVLRRRGKVLDRSAANFGLASEEPSLLGASRSLG